MSLRERVVTLILVQRWAEYRSKLDDIRAILDRFDNDSAYHAELEEIREVLDR